MLIEHQQRESRVRFQHPIRVVTLEGRPRVIRTLTSNVSRDGLFLRMPEPLPPGMKVALSLEAGGRALALAQAEVVWTGVDERELSERFPGCGVRFTEFMHPRAEELVRYLVHNLDKGKPLMLAPPERRWMRWAPWAAAAALLVCAGLAMLVLWGSSNAELDDEPPPSLTLVAEPPTVRAVAPEKDLRTPSEAPRAEVPPQPEANLAAPPVAPSAKPGSLTPSAPTQASAPAVKPDALLVPSAPIALEGPKSSAGARPDALTAPNAALDPDASASTAAKPDTLTVPNAPALDPKSDALSVPNARALEPSTPKTGAPGASALGVPQSSSAETKPDALPTPSAAPPRSSAAAKPDALDGPKGSPAVAKPEPGAPIDGVGPKPTAPARAVAKADVPVVAKKTVAAKDVQRGTLKLPSGAAVSLTWALAGAELRLSPELPAGARVTHAFLLTNPARAVFDLSGSAPQRSHVVPASPPYATAVRLGKQGAGTRIVVDLDSAPKRSAQDGDALVLSF